MLNPILRNINLKPLNYLCLATLLTLGLSACKSTPKSDYDTTFDFTGLSSFAHMQHEQPPQDTISADRIRDAISATLISKGFVEDTDNPSFQVNYRFLTKEKPKDSNLSIGLGTGTSGRNGSIGIGTSIGVPVGQTSVTERFIQIDIIDPKQNKLIWRGDDKFDFDRDGQAKQQETTATVSHILSVFPPQPNNN
ncbi:DUF4136 domain-containing protein [Shewanella maritima]|uniref:DUF4136 domain-containing protein n=1 Tax=Shewanella maritima TaxID=2520507 RepID=UPI003734D2E6